MHEYYFFQGWIYIFRHIFPVDLFFSFSALLPLPASPSREAIQGTFSSDHKDPWYCHWGLIRHSSCPSYYLHPGPDEAAKEKGNSSVVLDLFFFFFLVENLEIARGEMAHSRIK